MARRGRGVNLDDLKFWLDWYEQLDRSLEEAAGAVTRFHDPDGDAHHAVDAGALPVLHRLRELFRQAGTVDVFCPREASGTQLWPACWQEPARAAALVRLVEEPAYLAQDGGLRARDPEAPSGLCRLIDLVEAAEFCRVVSRKAGERCPAWVRVVPELFHDGTQKVVAEAIPGFELLPADAVEATLEQLGLPREAMSPFLPFVDRELSLRRLVRDAELVTEAEAESEAAPAPVLRAV